MALANVMVERVCKQLKRAEQDIRSIAGTDVAVRREHLSPGDVQIQVEVEGDDVAADLLVDVQREVVIARKVQVEKASKTRDLLKACEHLRRQVDCGSLLVSPGPIDDGVDGDETWERAGFRKTYFMPTTGDDPDDPDHGGDDDHRDAGDSESADALSDGGGLLPREQVLRYLAEVEKAVGERLEWGFALAERPYIVSLDISTSLEDGEEAPFHCFVHFHELTGACYIEKIVVPPDLRGHGIGSKVVHEIQRLSRRAGCRYLYLIAKKGAEDFWAKQGFASVRRVNYRNRRRREDALCKRPGWESVLVEGHRLKNPVWHYRNHPQDDVDLASGLRLLNLSASPKRILR